MDCRHLDRAINAVDSSRVTRVKNGLGGSRILGDGSSPVSWNPLASGDRARFYFNETSAACIATFGVPVFSRRVSAGALWPQGSPQSAELLRHRAASRHAGAFGRFRPASTT